MSSPLIPQFNAYSVTGAPPFLFNATYDITQANEANTYNQISSEFHWLYGSDLVFMPRDVNKEEAIFGEYLASKISKGYSMRAFIEEVEAWGGNGDMYSKFGLQVQDECTIHINKTSWLQATTDIYPKQSDLIYVPKSQKLFAISHIEDEVSPGFYLFGNRTGYKIFCKLFSYSHEEISQDTNTNIPSAIAALDSLMSQSNTTEVVSLDVKDVNNNNVPISVESTNIIVNTEIDPLLGY